MLTRFWLWLITALGGNPRGLFVFWDGLQWRRVDPFPIARVLFSHSTFDWDETPEELRGTTVQEQLGAFATIASAVREAFAILPVDRGGLTEEECFGLLSAFRHYMGDVKKNGSLYPISPPPMESQPAEESRMKPALVSGLTATERYGGKPGSPPVLT